MGAREKTDKLIRLADCPLDLLVKNEQNPNVMRPREFDLLCDNLNQTGWTDPALVCPVKYADMQTLINLVGDNEKDLIEGMQTRGDPTQNRGGHHRFDAATYLGFERGPVTIIMNPDFDNEMETFQLVRMNVIHGKLDPQAFIALMGDLSGKYSDEMLQDMFGFADDMEYRRLTKQMAKALPNKAAQDKFKKAAQEIKTIDGLANLLNTMFTKFGDTLPYGYMVFEYGKQRSMWLRVESKTMKALELLGVVCVENQRTMDDLVGRVIQLMAAPDGQEFLKSLIEETPAVHVPAGLTVTPTKDNLKEIHELL